ncbi:MAG: sugar-binding protein [Bacteroidota bacterium]
MKNLLQILASVVFCFLFTWHVSAQGGAGYSIEAQDVTGETVTIDGNDDEGFWSNATEEFIELNPAGEQYTLPATDFTGSFKVAFDETGFYFLGYLTDDVINLMQNTDDDNAWKHDSWEIYFNPTGEVLNTDNGNYSVHYASQLTFPLGEDEDNTVQGNSSTADLSDHSIEWATSSNYDIIEIFIPWEEIIHPDSISGDGFSSSDLYSNWKFDVAYNDSDRDGTAGRDDQIIWNGTGENWQNVMDWGDLILDISTDYLGGAGYSIDAMEITGQSVTIDGNDDEGFWADAMEEFVELNNEGEPHTLPATDFDGSFKVAFDETGFYFLGYLTDDVMNLMQDTDDNNAWRHDSWEIYFNPTGEVLNTDNGNYSLHYASQFTFPLGEDEDNTVQGNSSTADLENHGIVWATSPTYDIIEIFFPWEEIIHPDSISGESFSYSDLYSNWKFDVAYNDSDRDGVDGRDDQLIWNGNGNNWQNVSEWGDLILVFSATSVNEVQTNNQIAVYPNPVVDQFFVSENVLSVSVYNVIGKKIKYLTPDDLSIRGLESGMYILNIELEDGNIVTKKILKK